MEPETRIWKTLILMVFVLFISDTIHAEQIYPGPGTETDSVSSAPALNSFSDSSISLIDHFNYEPRFLHQLSFEARPAYVFPTMDFLKGYNAKDKRINWSMSAHLKYSFKFLPNSFIDRIYAGAYQGIGLSYYNFGNREELGNPMAIYLFQGARIARLHPRISLNYEWNFGLSFGWKPYDPETNSWNQVIGSEVNAYINANFYFTWMLSRRFDLTSGVEVTHFSNGNTKFPNAGLNTIGLKVGLVYNINRHNLPRLYPDMPPAFTRHISYDAILFGAWRRKGVPTGDRYVASPHSYGVAGFNFAPMYNFGYKFRAGISLDGYYDGSANVHGNEYDYEPEFVTPPFQNQLALGLSARAEYVMPYFSVNVGLGANILHGGGDMKGLYQILALKVGMTRSSYLHIGYSLKDFHMPNFLMLGIGFRFNNKYPRFNR